MKKKLKNSLAAKIFLLALSLLLLCSLTTCFFISMLMPKTYSSYLNDNLDRKARQLVSVLETVTLSNSGALFDSFIETSDVSSVELLDEYGFYVELPTQVFPYEAISEYVYDAVSDVLEGILPFDPESSFISQEGYETAFWGEAYEIQEENFVYSSEETSTLSMQSYPFSFFNDSARYTLLVSGNSKPISQFKQVFLQLMPFLLLLTVLIAVLAALLFSYIVTKPIKELSGVALKMSRLSLDWHYDGKRTDELGILEQSLDTLSRSLSAALSDLKTANQKLQEDIEKEKQFFSAVSHELKTPITVIKGQLEGMLFDIGAYKDHKKYLARSLSVAGTLETMVQEILTVSRLETAALSYSTFDIAPVIKECLLSMEDLLISRELALHTQIEAPCMVTGSKLMLSKTVGNLISNAVYYSPQENEIFITAKTIKDSFTFRIENTGIHIPESSLPRLFEPFYRVDQSRNRRTGGSGLGLYIVQKILEQHNSQCVVQNTERGVCFSFILPLYFSSP